MKLEGTVLWDEKDLFTEEGKSEYGFLGYVRGWFTGGSFLLERCLQEKCELTYEFESLIIYLRSSEAGYLLRSVMDMTVYCENRIKSHIPYAFSRECWGFRVLTDDTVWYIACTPWNEKPDFEIYVYERKMLMTQLAERRGLPENCYGVPPYSGERVFIRFGVDDYEAFPQYGGNADENRKYADEMNTVLGVSRAQVAAMENGAIYGWDTPVADPLNYDKDGHFTFSANKNVRKEEKKRWALHLKR